MNPETFADMYLKLTWEYDKKSFQVSVNSYLALDPEICDQKKINGSKKARGWLDEAIKKAPDIEEVGDVIQVKDMNKLIPRKHVDKAFKGKGSPSQIADTLWLATHLKFITASPTDPKVEGREAARPQDYVKWYLGTDCSGFANNYLGLNENPSTIEAFDKDKSARRQSIDAIKMGDVMIKRSIGANDYTHIAIVTQVLKKSNSSMQLFTVESYGWKLAGIGRHDRNLIMTSSGVFVEPPKKEAEIYFHPPTNREPNL